MTRLSWLASAVCALTLAPPQTSRHTAVSAAPGLAYKLTADDRALLDDLSRRSFRFFWDQADATTGIVRDMASPTRFIPPTGGSIPMSSASM